MSVEAWPSEPVNRPLNTLADCPAVYAPRPAPVRSDPGLAPEPPRWERVAAIVVIVLLTGALIGPIFAPTQDETPILRLIWFPIYAVILTLAAVRIRSLARLWPAALLLAGLVLLAFASRWWSIDPSTTGRRAIALGISMLFGLYLAAAWRGPALPRLLCQAFLLMGLGSLFMVFAFPSIGVHPEVNPGMWRGMWYEKNQMGAVMSAGSIAAAALIASGAGRRLGIATLFVCIPLLLATQSKTALLCMLAGTGLITGLAMMRRAGPAGAVIMTWLGVVVLAGGLGLFIAAPEVVFELLGKDPSLTGRTDIWAALLRRADARPWLGYGYSAFWGLDSVPANWVRAETHWLVPSAHNGWIEVLIQLGRIGVVAVGVVMLIAVAATLIRLATDAGQQGYWAAGWLIAFGILSMSESVLMLHHNLWWVLFISAFASQLAPSLSPAPRRPPVRRAPSGRPLRPYPQPVR